MSRRPRKPAPRRRPSGRPASSAEGRGEPERLQKALARAGLASRREVEAWIRAGRLTVNGRPASLGVRVGPADEVRLDGRLVRQRTPESTGRAFIFHRSPGERLEDAPPPAEGGPQAVSDSVSVSQPPFRPRTGGSQRVPSTSRPVPPPLLSRLPKRAGRRFIVVSPMPRIDGGLELLSSDGELALRLQRCVRRLSSELSVRVRGELTAGQLDGILGGALDSGERVEVLSCEAAGGEGANRWYAVTARGASGKDVRRLFERQGATVSRVLRTRLGPLVLERSLGRGRHRELTREELEALLLAAAAESQ